MNDLPNFCPFTFLLTPDQLERLRVIARERKWLQPMNRGVLVDAAKGYHPVISRSKKDNLTLEEITELLTGGYHKKAQVYANPTYTNQYYLLNENKRLKQSVALVIVAVTNEENGEIQVALRPETAYWVNRAKLAGVKGKRK